MPERLPSIYRPCYWIFLLCNNNHLNMFENFCFAHIYSQTNAKPLTHIWYQQKHFLQSPKITFSKSHCALHSNVLLFLQALFMHYSPLLLPREDSREMLRTHWNIYVLLSIALLPTLLNSIISSGEPSMVSKYSLICLINKLPYSQHICSIFFVYHNQIDVSVGFQFLRASFEKVVKLVAS